MQDLIIRLDHDTFVESAATTASGDKYSKISVDSGLVLRDGIAKEQVIDELVDSIVRRYKRALDKLGRE